MAYLRFGFDLDGCIIQFDSVFSKVIEAKYGIRILPSEVRTFDYTKCNSEITNEIANDCVNITLTMVDKLEPHPGAITFLKRYHEKTKYHLQFITSRPDRKSTADWLHRWLHPIPWEVSFVPGGPKVNRIIEKDIDVFIEDRVRNVHQIADKERCVWMPNRTWNQHADDSNQYVIRFSDWYEAMEMYEKVNTTTMAEMMGITRGEILRRKF